MLTSDIWSYERIEASRSEEQRQKLHWCSMYTIHQNNSMAYSLTALKYMACLCLPHISFCISIRLWFYHSFDHNWCEESNDRCDEEVDEELRDRTNIGNHEWSMWNCGHALGPSPKYFFPDHIKLINWIVPLFVWQVPPSVPLYYCRLIAATHYKGGLKTP